MQFALNVLKFEDCREQVIKFLSEKSEYAGQFDFRSSNLSYFVDTMTYILMHMNFSVAHIANNRFLDTTEIRKNGVSRAHEIGYTPKRPYSAKFRGKLIYKGANFVEGNTLTIYPRSPFGGSFGNTYTNMEPIVLKYNGNPTQLEGEYTLSEGVFKYFKIATTGQQNFSFTIANPNCDAENFSLFVIPLTAADNPINGLIEAPYNLTNFLQYKWTKVKTFQEMVNPKIYYMEEDIQNEGFPKIAFGNGMIGAVPMDTEVIYCEYFETKGSAANNENLISLPPMDKVTGTDQVYTFYGTEDMGVDNKTNFNVNNFDISYQNTYNKSYGGSDLETLESIKANAPKYYSSAGRAATKNDYIYILKSFAGVGAVNVIGGDELYPNDITQLGNIYTSVVPNIDRTNFLYNNNIYLSPQLENDIRNQLDAYAILSTKRHFYKPSYILIDVTPNIELTKNVTITEQNKIRTQVQNIITTYFNNTYNDLGIPFRESKVSVNVDGLDYISSSYVDLVFSFIINNNTVANLIEGVNNILYLPTKKVKDSSGNVVGTTNFIKTNDQVVKEDLFPGDWSILDKSYEDLLSDHDEAGQRLYAAKLKLLNTYQNYMKPEQCSIYSEGGLINPTLSRSIYNRDFTDITVAELWYVPGLTNMHTIPYTYQDKLKNTVTVKINMNPDNVTRNMIFSIKDLDGIDRDYAVATLIDSHTNGVYDVEVSLSNENIVNLYAYFGIDESRFIYSGAGNTKSPFNVVPISSTRFAIQMKINTFISELIMNGRNDLYDVLIDTDKSMLPTALTSNSMWNLLPVVKDGQGNATSFTPMTMTVGNSTDTIGYIEMSHTNLPNAAVVDNSRWFKGFIGTKPNQLSYAAVEASLQTVPALYSEGDYFIITEFTYVPNSVDPTQDKYLYPNDIVFVNSSNHLETAVVKRTISSLKPQELSTTFAQGDLFVDGSDYWIYDETIDPDKEYPNYAHVAIHPFTGVDGNGIGNASSFAVDATQALPTALVENTIVKIQLSDTADGGVTGGGVSITYPNTYHDKIGQLYHRQPNGSWTAMTRVVNGQTVPDTRVKDGDLLLYAGGKWRLMDNINRTVPTAWDSSVQYAKDELVVFNGTVYVCIQTALGANPSAAGNLFWKPFTDRVIVGAENTTELGSVTTGLYNIYKITTDIVLSGDDFAMFTKLPTDNMLISGNYIVCVDETNNLWEVYTGDIYQFQIDAENENSAFPVFVSVGDVFHVTVPRDLDLGSATLNFNGDTRTVVFQPADKIVYVGVDEMGVPRWKKFVPTDITTQFDPDITAAVGDLIMIKDADGNLGNDTAKLDVPVFTDGNMIFNYNDILFFTGTHWIKAKPINAYNVPNRPLVKQSINLAGFNSDIMIDQNTPSTFKIYMLDQFHNAVIGKLDYYTGRLTLTRKINQTLNKNDVVIGKADLSDIFKAENYLTNARQMDTIRMTPIRQKESQNADGDFDTNFNQYIVANVKDVQII